MPLPVMPETVSRGTPRAWLSPSSSAALMPLNRALGPSGHVPFVDRDDQRAAFLEHIVGDLQVLHLEPARGVEQQHDDFGEIDRAAGIGDRQLLELVLDLGLLAHAGGVDQPHRPRLPVRRLPFPVDGDANRG